MAEDIYEECLNEYTYTDLLTDDELENFLLEYEYWSPELEAEVKTLIDNMEQLKVDLYNYVFRERERLTARKLLEVSRNRYHELYAQKHCFDYLTINGLSTLIKSQFVIYSTLCDKQGKRLFNPKNFWLDPEHISTTALNKYNAALLNESGYREISRTDPWRSAWNIRGNNDMFGKFPVDYSDEQRIVTTWSSLYDRVYESSDCPDDEIIEDDDILDGWMIIKRRERNDNAIKRRGENTLKNDRIANSDEIFIVANSNDDIRRVDSMNDNVGKLLKKQRSNVLLKEKEVKDTDLPDIKLKYVTAAQQRISQLQGRK